MNNFLLPISPYQ